ncbi:MerC mercury resistance protein [Leeuwenhoekiella aestuarii]|uniref:MerC mercury resistance protein n=1 Tax=Leeuwenhoekiella aestuarii TaxID=2249426 RepID=A0A4Q0NN40_9FLAO|nr:MerC domain-containing protein [Leeuwenhoekiella aestuarii]RXG11225.1 MerC mercury resistance protein [Leeuwenhoekiella aestuarii]RXG11591.1 MerC mercury resistance protein [Leeuwenhoekiella aestuarii]
MKAKYFDIIGVYAAFLCLIHCILAPVLFLLPLELSHNPLIDISFLAIGLFPVIQVVRSNAPVYLKILIAVSWTLIAAAIAFEVFLHQDTSLIYFGAIGLISGHLFNYSNHKH